MILDERQRVPESGKNGMSLKEKNADIRMNDSTPRNNKRIESKSQTDYIENESSAQQLSDEGCVVGGCVPFRWRSILFSVRKKPNGNEKFNTQREDESISMVNPSRVNYQFHHRESYDPVANNSQMFMSGMTHDQQSKLSEYFSVSNISISGTNNMASPSSSNLTRTYQTLNQNKLTASSKKFSFAQKKLLTPSPTNSYNESPHDPSPELQNLNEDISIAHLHENSPASSESVSFVNHFSMNQTPQRSAHISSSKKIISKNSFEQYDPYSHNHADDEIYDVSMLNTGPHSNVHSSPTAMPTIPSISSTTMQLSGLAGMLFGINSHSETYENYQISHNTSNDPYQTPGIPPSSNSMAISVTSNKKFYQSFVQQNTLVIARSNSLVGSNNQSIGVLPNQPAAANPNGPMSLTSTISANSSTSAGTIQQKTVGSNSIHNASTEKIGKVTTGNYQDPSSSIPILPLDRSGLHRRESSGNQDYLKPVSASTAAATAARNVDQLLLNSDENLKRASNGDRTLTVEDIDKLMNKREPSARLITPRVTSEKNDRSSKKIKGTNEIQVDAVQNQTSSNSSVALDPNGRQSPRNGNQLVSKPNLAKENYSGINSPVSNSVEMRSTTPLTNSGSLPGLQLDRKTSPQMVLTASGNTAKLGDVVSPSTPFKLLSKTLNTSKEETPQPINDHPSEQISEFYPIEDSFLLDSSKKQTVNVITNWLTVPKTFAVMVPFIYFDKVKQLGGLRFGYNHQNHLIVSGFNRHPTTDEMLVGQKSGKFHIGDKILKANSTPIDGTVRKDQFVSILKSFNTKEVVLRMESSVELSPSYSCPHCMKTNTINDKQQYNWIKGIAFPLDKNDFLDRQNSQSDGSESTNLECSFCKQKLSPIQNAPLIETIRKVINSIAAAAASNSANLNFNSRQSHHGSHRKKSSRRGLSKHTSKDGTADANISDHRSEGSHSIPEKGELKVISRQSSQKFQHICSDQQFIPGAGSVDSNDSSSQYSLFSQQSSNVTRPGSMNRSSVKFLQQNQPSFQELQNFFFDPNQAIPRDGSMDENASMEYSQHNISPRQTPGENSQRYKNGSYSKISTSGASYGKTTSTGRTTPATLGATPNQTQAVVKQRTESQRCESQKSESYSTGGSGNIFGSRTSSSHKEEGEGVAVRKTETKSQGDEEIEEDRQAAKYSPIEVSPQVIGRRSSVESSIGSIPMRSTDPYDNHASTDSRDKNIHKSRSQQEIQDERVRTMMQPLNNTDTGSVVSNHGESKATSNNTSENSFPSDTNEMPTQSLLTASALQLLSRDGSDDEKASEVVEEVVEEVVHTSNGFKTLEQGVIEKDNHLVRRQLPLPPLQLESNNTSPVLVTHNQSFSPDGRQLHTSDAIPIPINMEESSVNNQKHIVQWARGAKNYAVILPIISIQGRRHLGIKFDYNKFNRLVVFGYYRNHTEPELLLPAESCGKFNIGDAILRLNKMTLEPTTTKEQLGRLIANLPEDEVCVRMESAVFTNLVYHCPNCAMVNVVDEKTEKTLFRTLTQTQSDNNLIQNMFKPSTASELLICNHCKLECIAGPSPSLFQNFSPNRRNASPVANTPSKSPVQLPMPLPLPRGQSPVQRNLESPALARKTAIANPNAPPINVIPNANPFIPYHQQKAGSNFFPARATPAAAATAAVQLISTQSNAHLGMQKNMISNGPGQNLDFEKGITDQGPVARKQQLVPQIQQPPQMKAFGSNNAFRKAPTEQNDYESSMTANQRRIIDAMKATELGGETPNVPYELLLEWTDGFTPSRKLGEGGFGEVYEGVYRDTVPSNTPGGSGTRSKYNGRVAIKRLSSNVQLDVRSALQAREEAISSAKREMNVLRSFKHPNIIRLLGYSMPSIEEQQQQQRATALNGIVHPLNLCLIYELAPRGGLNRYLFDDKKAQELEWKKRISTAYGVACALNFLHRYDPGNPAFHRDVKSANIALTNDFTPKLIDCGLAKYIPKNIDHRFSIVTKTGHVFGTPGYMCPKYVNSNGKYDEKSEVYSFGVVLAELLSGRLQGQNKLLLGYDIELSRIRPDPRAGDWPPECVNTLRKLAIDCMEDYRRRIPNMMVIVHALKQLELAYCVSQQKQMQYVKETMLQLEKAKEEISALKGQLQAVAKSDPPVNPNLKADPRSPITSHGQNVNSEYDENMNFKATAHPKTYQSSSPVTPTPKPHKLNPSASVADMMSPNANQSKYGMGQEEVKKTKSLPIPDTASIGSTISTDRKKECKICFEMFLLDAGIECEPPQPNQEKHFHCDACFQGDYMKLQLSADERDTFKELNAQIVCKWCLPNVVCFSELNLARHLDPLSFALYQRARNEVAQEILLRESCIRSAVQFKQELDSMRNILANKSNTSQKLTAETQRLYLHRLFIAENILCIRCPKCDGLNADFESCFLMTCRDCQHEFCGCCLSDCGNDSDKLYDHIPICNASVKKGNYYGSVNDFNKVHAARRTSGVQLYLKEIVEERDRESVKILIASDLKELGIHLS